MVIKKELLVSAFKPIIAVYIRANGRSMMVNALLDSGSSKAFWIDDFDKLNSFKGKHLSDNGVASGFGVQAQRNCSVDMININIFDDVAWVGVNFLDLPVTSAKLAGVKGTPAFSLILPYTLFINFERGYLPPDDENRFGVFFLDTRSSQVNYKVEYTSGDHVHHAYATAEEPPDPTIPISIFG